MTAPAYNTPGNATLKTWINAVQTISITQAVAKQTFEFKMAEIFELYDPLRRGELEEKNQKELVITIKMLMVKKCED